MALYLSLIRNACKITIQNWNNPLQGIIVSQWPFNTIICLIHIPHVQGSDINISNLWRPYLTWMFSRYAVIPFYIRLTFFYVIDLTRGWGSILAQYFLDELTLKGCSSISWYVKLIFYTPLSLSGTAYVFCYLFFFYKRQGSLDPCCLCLVTSCLRPAVAVQCACSPLMT